jgi:hypothetical protein
MPSIFDLMPASLWPVQPFVPPDEQARTLVALQSQLAPRDPWTVPRLDPTPPDPASTLSSSSVPGWTLPAATATPSDWPKAPVDRPPYADASVSEWDRAMRQTLARQGRATGAPDLGYSASFAQTLADAKRTSQAARTSTTMPSGAPQDFGDTLPNVAASFADAVPRPGPAARDAALAAPQAGPAMSTAGRDFFPIQIPLNVSLSSNRVPPPWSPITDPGAKPKERIDAVGSHRRIDVGLESDDAARAHLVRRPRAKTAVAA